MMTLAPADVFRVALRAAVRDGFFTPFLASRIARSLRLPVTWLPGRDQLNVHVTDETWPMIFLELETLVSHGWHNAVRIDWKEAAARIAAMKIEQLLTLHDDLQTQFEHRQRRLAMLLFTGALSLAAWRYNFWSLARKLMISQAALGKGKPLEGDELNQLLDLLQREASYVDNFQQAIFAGKVEKETGIKSEKKTAASEEAVAARGDLYAGTPRGLFAETMEAEKRWEPGTVMEYIPKDDDNTCEPCHAARGYYLPGEGPMPGMICEGRGKCRCKRVPRFMPEKYQEFRAILS